ncbi:MAG: translation initiation factor IF-3, partial [Pseudomonadota bacterium]|nr:translation initiation factor IF-3 [Pseudomonadota bacterium]
MPPVQDGPRINGAIRVPKVRCIDPDGNQLGIIDTRDAIEKAGDFGLDLVEVQPNAEPPVCKILDYGKFKY